jgi:signal transduction histidine kinase
MEVIPGLNSVRLIESTYRLEFNDDSTIDNQVGSDVSNILTLVKYGDDTFRLIRDLLGSKGNLEGTVVHRLTVPRT